MALAVRHPPASPPWPPQSDGVAPANSLGSVWYFAEETVAIRQLVSVHAFYAREWAGAVYLTVEETTTAGQKLGCLGFRAILNEEQNGSVLCDVTTSTLES